MKQTYCYKRKNLNKKIGCLILVILAVLASMTFYVSVQDNMDFIRIQELMDPLRRTNISLGEYLVPKENHALNRTMSYTFTFNTLLYLFAKGFKNNYVFVWASVAIDYTLVAYMIYDWTRDRKCRILEKVSIFLTSMAFLPFVHACSGIRAAMAACLMALAVYGFLYRNRGMVYFAVFVFLSVTVHPFVIYAVPVAVLVKYAPKMSVCILVWLGTVGLVYIVPILAALKLPFVSVLATKYATYTSSNQFTSYRSFFYSALLCSLLLIVYYVFFYWRVFAGNYHKKEPNKYRLFTFIAAYAGVVLGSFGSYDIACRLAYVLGAFAPVIVKMITSGRRKDEIRHFVAIALYAAFMILCVYTFSKHIRYYGGHFSLDNIALALRAGR